MIFHKSLALFYRVIPSFINVPPSSNLSLIYVQVPMSGCQSLSGKKWGVQRGIGSTDGEEARAIRRILVYVK